MMKRSDRKKFLLAQGAVYRSEALQARQQAVELLKPRTLARRAAQGVPAAALALLGNRSALGIARVGMRVAWPLLASAAAMLKRTSTSKPLLRRALAAAALATVATVVIRAARIRRHDDAADAPERHAD